MAKFQYKKLTKKEIGNFKFTKRELKKFFKNYYGGKDDHERKHNIFSEVKKSLSSNKVFGDVLTGSWESERIVGHGKKDYFETTFEIDGITNPIKIGRKYDSFLGNYKNARVVKSGNLKVDYHNKGKKLAEVSVFKEYIDDLFHFDRISGDLRINTEHDSLLLLGNNFNGKDPILLAKFEFDI